MLSAKVDSFSEEAQRSLLFDKIIDVAGEDKEEMEGYGKVNDILRSCIDKSCRTFVDQSC